MSKFKVGDKVRCRCGNRFLLGGEIYSVEGVDFGKYVRLVGVCGHAFNPDSFELVEDTSNRRPHYDLIIAWASGAEIECKNAVGRWFQPEVPGWASVVEYRIKPTNPEKEKLEQLISDMDKQLTDAKNRLKEIAGE